jgi:Trypsin
MMSRRQVTRIAFSLVGAVMFPALGCGAGTHGARLTPPQEVPAEIQPELGESIISSGSLDTSNHYGAAVMVSGGRGTCSGALIAPRVVLTAAHCVCTQRAVSPGEGLARALIDKTTCAPTASVRVWSYRSGGASDDEFLTGRVRPHGQLQILYNQENRELSSRADLAVIVLRTAPKNINPMRLATEQLRYAQPVTLVGYGATVPRAQSDNVRRFGFNEVASIAENGATFMVGKPVRIRRPYKPKEPLLVRDDASYGLGGDSGGPCIRERGSTMELVGIAKTYYGGQDLAQFSEYTNTYFYLGWLKQEIANAERNSAD